VSSIRLVIGTRPEMVQALPLVQAAARANLEFRVVTVSQHTDPIMTTEVLPTDLTAGWPVDEVSVLPFSLAAGLSAVQSHLAADRPGAVIVIGDTDTSLGAALAATELRIPVTHVEAGLRSGDWAMKEERNRVLIDHLSSAVFPPTVLAEDRLHAEHVHGRIVRTGDVHVDALRILRERGVFDISTREATDYAAPFVLCTLHRRENILDPIVLARLVDLLGSLPMEVRFAVHPHTKLRLDEFGLFERLTSYANVVLTPPLAFLEFMKSLSESAGVVTDSGGVQKQAWMMERPCITLRTSTEWVETLAGGWNRLVDPMSVTTLAAPYADSPHDQAASPFGDGHAAEKILEATMQVVQ
jgi:UDP-N-acetylglucosamine 2-epimerase (non-hydrolysing)